MEKISEQKAREWATSETNNSEATGKKSPTTDMASKYAHIKGWGIDADPENEPTYPMKNWNGADYQRLNYDRPTQQPETVEVLHSNERPYVTAVFGTTCPPQGLSGRLRRHAFKYSEGNWNHWLTLLLADRVNMVEGIVDDIKKGRFPNFIAETGWTAEWKYNRKNFVKNMAITAGVAAGLLMLFRTARRLRGA